MGILYLVSACVLLLVLASADGVLWKYSEEREELRARAALAEQSGRSMAAELRALRRENAELREFQSEALSPAPIGESAAPACER